jgi:hypothetical protein
MDKARRGRHVPKDPAERPQQVHELIAGFSWLLRKHPWTQEAAVRRWRDFDAARETVVA